MDSSALMTITNRPEAVMVKGEGSYLYDASGKAYLDFVQGWAVNALGHSPKEIVNALNEQSQQLVNPSPAFYNQSMIKLADLLVANSCFEKVFFANSGAEANEGAIKLARKWGSKNKNGAFEIITFDKSFHGRTLATMSASGKKGWDSIFAPMPDGFAKAHLNDLTSVETKINDNTVAVMLEPIQGEGGVIPAETEFLKQLRLLTQKHNLLLIVDEVQTGMGRTGHRFAYESANIEPDIMTLGKGLGGGVPLSALLAKEEACCFEPGDQGGTYNGNPLMTAVGLAVAQRVLDDDFLSSVRQKSSYLQNKLEGLSEQFNLGKVRGRGLLLGLSLNGQFNGPTIVKEALEQGLLLNAPNADLLRFMPALNVAEEEIDQMIELLVETLQSLKG